MLKAQARFFCYVQSVHAPELFFCLQWVQSSQHIGIHSCACTLSFFCAGIGFTSSEAKQNILFWIRKAFALSFHSVCISVYPLSYKIQSVSWILLKRIARVLFICPRKWLPRYFYIFTSKCARPVNDSSLNPSLNHICKSIVFANFKYFSLTLILQNLCTT